MGVRGLSIAGTGCVVAAIVTYPIGYAGSFYANETPFTSDHTGGGVNMLFCDGSVHYLAKSTDLSILQNMATRSNGEVVSLP